MAKKFFKQLLPSVTNIKSHPRLQFLGRLLQDPNLWHLNRRSLAGGMAVGLFSAFIPLPMQMLWAALLAMLFRVNLPLSVTLIWITNPITIPPMFYMAYKVGTFVLGWPAPPITFQFSAEWMWTTFQALWLPLIVGSLLVGLFTAAVGYYTVHYLWRLHVRRLWKNRREKRLLIAKQRALQKLEENNSSQQEVTDA